MSLNATHQARIADTRISCDTWYKKSKPVSWAANRVREIRRILPVVGCVFGCLSFKELLATPACYLFSSPTSMLPICSGLSVSLGIGAIGATITTPLIVLGANKALKNTSVQGIYNTVFGKTSSKRYQDIDDIIACLEKLSQRIPPLPMGDRTPTSLDDLIIKLTISTDQATRDDYQHLVEHTLTQSQRLFGWYSITGAHRKPFDHFIRALKGNSPEAIAGALDSVLEKLLELRQKRTNPPASEKPPIHPRLKELAEILISNKKAFLLHDNPNRGLILRLNTVLNQCLNIPSILSLISLTERTSLKKLSRDISSYTDSNGTVDLEKQIDEALNILSRIYPESHSDIELILKSPELFVQSQIINDTD